MYRDRNGELENMISQLEAVMKQSNEVIAHFKKQGTDLAKKARGVDGSRVLRRGSHGPGRRNIFEAGGGGGVLLHPAKDQ